MFRKDAQKKFKPQQKNSNDYYITNSNVSFFDSTDEDRVSLGSISPPQLPPKSSNTLNNIHVNGHSNIMQNSSGKSSSNNVTSSNSIDWIELKTANRTNARFPAPKPPSSSYGEVKKNDVIIPQFISSNGNLSVRLAPLPRRMHQYSIP